MKRNLLFVVLASSCLMGLCGCDKGESTAPPAATAPTKPDNTAMNKVDRDAATTTPMSQGENATDIKTTADIRRALMDDKSLSTDAHNAKIITDKGVVTLRGVVDSAAEKEEIETKAKEVAGVTSVENQLEVKNP